jgi:hypothetical protein
MTDQPPKAVPSKTRQTASNGLPFIIQYENSTNEEFPPLPAKTNSVETRSTASSTHLTFNNHSIQKAILESKSEWQADTRKFQDEIRASHRDLQTSIKIMIDESLATQVKKIVSATVAEFGNNENYTLHHLIGTTRHIVQGFTREMTRQIKELSQHDTPTRKSPAKKQQLSPNSPSNFDYGTPSSTAMDAEIGNAAHARRLSFNNSYDTPPRGGSKHV